MISTVFELNNKNFEIYNLSRPLRTIIFVGKMIDRVKNLA